MGFGLPDTASIVAGDSHLSAVVELLTDIGIRETIASTCCDCVRRKIGSA